MSNTIQIKKGKPIIIKKESEVARSVYNYNVKKPELDLFDQYAKEHTRIVGTPMEYFKLNINGSEKNFYGEPINNGEGFQYSNPFKIYAHVLWPNPNLRVQEAGVNINFSSVLWISRKEVEDVGMEAPHAGDIIKFWDLLYFNKLANDDEDGKGTGMYFDVIDAKDDGHIKDTPYFVGFKLEIKRTSRFEAERKLDPGTEGRDC